MVTVLKAGFLSWIFYCLARNPRVWDILRQEILNDFGREKPTYQQLKDAKYLKWVLNEGRFSMAVSEFQKKKMILTIIQSCDCIP